MKFMQQIFEQNLVINGYSISCEIALSAPFYEHGLNLILAWISNYTHYRVWDEITYPFLNFNGATVDV